MVRVEWYLHSFLHAVDLQGADPFREWVQSQMVEGRGVPFTLLSE